VLQVVAAEANSRSSQEEVSRHHTLLTFGTSSDTISGGKHFSRNLRPLDADGNEINEKNPEATSSEEEEDSEEESSEEEDANKPTMTREERRAAAKAKKEAAIARKKGQVAQPGDLPSSSEEESEDDMPANPNHSKAARNQAKAAPVSVDEATEGVNDLSVGGKGKGKPAAELSRREREALQAQQAKERYQKLHEAGKTDEAKADLARLKLIREKREAEAARKQVSPKSPMGQFIC
jgi:hypothetical protein